MHGRFRVFGILPALMIPLPFWLKIEICSGKGLLVIDEENHFDQDTKFHLECAYVALKKFFPSKFQDKDVIVSYETYNSKMKLYGGSISLPFALSAVSLAFGIRIDHVFSCGTLDDRGWIASGSFWESTKEKIRAASNLGFNIFIIPRYLKTFDKNHDLSIWKVDNLFEAIWILSPDIFQEIRQNALKRIICPENYPELNFLKKVASNIYMDTFSVYLLRSTDKQLLRQLLHSSKSSNVICKCRDDIRIPRLFILQNGAVLKKDYGVFRPDEIAMLQNEVEKKNTKALYDIV